MNLKSLKLNFQLPDLKKSISLSRGKQSKSQEADTPHINPRFRAYGKARLDIASRVQSQSDWDALWKAPANPFSMKFPWGSSWKQCTEYCVSDFAAEIGFWIDIIGLQVNALGSDYAQFASPGGEISLAVVNGAGLSIDSDYEITPPGAFRMQFHIDEMQSTLEEFTKRNIQFELLPQSISEDSNMLMASFRTPHGIAVDLWSEGNFPITESLTDSPPSLTEVENDEQDPNVRDVSLKPDEETSELENNTGSKSQQESWREFLTSPSISVVSEDIPSVLEEEEVKNLDEDQPPEDKRFESKNTWREFLQLPGSNENPSDKHSTKEEYESRSPFKGDTTDQKTIEDPSQYQEEEDDLDDEEEEYEDEASSDDPVYEAVEDIEKDGLEEYTKEQKARYLNH